jgi:hypothetical protein
VWLNAAMAGEADASMARGESSSHVDQALRRAAQAEANLTRLRNRKSVRAALVVADAVGRVRRRLRPGVRENAPRAPAAADRIASDRSDLRAGSARPSGDRSALVPVVVMSRGRSGSTILMQLLATSPLVAFERVYPFERRYLTYMLRWALLLGESTDPTADWDGNTVMGRTQPMRPMPFRNRPLMERAPSQPPLPHVVFRCGWQAVSDRMREAGPRLLDRQPNGGGGREPICYAEKAANWVPDELSAMGVEHRRIDLVRDPRDVFISILSFNEQRNSMRFGFTENDTPMTYARRLARSEAARFREIRQLRSNANHLVVRYEELIGNMDAEANRIGGFLDVELDPPAALAASQRYTEHVTSSSIEASINRWRTMDPQLLGVFAEELGDAGAPFGYRV